MSFVSPSRARSAPVLPLAGMVDVLFLLLIFFMTASVFREQELQFDVALPAAETAEGVVGGAGQVVVTITEDNRILLGQREVTLGDLERLLGELADVSPDETVVVRGGENSRLGLSVRVMDIAQQAGLGEVTLATIRPPR